MTCILQPDERTAFATQIELAPAYKNNNNKSSDCSNEGTYLIFNPKSLKQRLKLKKKCVQNPPLRALAIKLEKFDRIPPTSIASNISAILKSFAAMGNTLKETKMLHLAMIRRERQ